LRRITIQTGSRGGGLCAIVVTLVFDVDRFIEPFDSFEMPLVYRVEANGTSDPFQVVRCTE